MCRCSINLYRRADPQGDDECNAAFVSPDIQDVHVSLDEYFPTPLVELPGLAAYLGLGRVLIKDEASRFGLQAFKALGASYAVYRFIKDQFAQEGRAVPEAKDFYRRTALLPPGRFTFCTATDGNHGRGVAWVARKLRQHAAIYMPKNTVLARIKSIIAEGAKVTIIDGHYDEAVEQAAKDAAEFGWQIISDTSWPGYVDIPRWIMAGYLTMFREIDETIGDKLKIDAVIVQGGVGALAAAASWHYNTEYKSRPVKLIAVEPTAAACLLASINSPEGEPRSIDGEFNTIMAGLNCGTPSPVAWPLIKQGFDAFMTVSDEQCIEAMLTYYYPRGDDPRLISGESGAAGLAALLSLCKKNILMDIRKKLGIDTSSTILLLNTEGDTDPESFAKLT